MPDAPFSVERRFSILVAWGGSRRRGRSERNAMLIVDCDCHNYWCSATVLEPYLEQPWRDYFVRGEKTGPVGAFPHGHRPWFHPEGFSRHDVRPETEVDNYRIMKEKHLDKYGIGYAILTGDEPVEASTLANPHYASALVRGLQQFPDRLLAAQGRPLLRLHRHRAAGPASRRGEIRRLGGHPRMVQVLASHGAQRPYGDPFYHPIYEACAEVGCPSRSISAARAGSTTTRSAPARARSSGKHTPSCRNRR
jgi:predicted TIM-barrel fold metal-dependent hydrolase